MIVDSFIQIYSKMTFGPGIDLRLQDISGKLVRQLYEVLDHKDITTLMSETIISYISETYQIYSKEKKEIEDKIICLTPSVIQFLQNQLVESFSYHYRSEEREGAIIHIWETDNPNAEIYKVEGRAKNSITNSLLRNFNMGRDVLDTGGITLFIRDPSANVEEDNISKIYELIERFKTNPLTKPFRVRKKYIISDFEARGIHQSIKCEYKGKVYPNILETNSPEVGKILLEDLLRKNDVEEIMIKGCDYACVYSSDDNDNIFALRDNIIIDYASKEPDLFSYPKKTDTILLAEVIIPRIIKKYEQRQRNLEEKINSLGLNNWWHLDSIVHSSRSFNSRIIIPEKPDILPSLRIYCYESSEDSREHLLASVKRINEYNCNLILPPTESFSLKVSNDFMMILAGHFAIECYLINNPYNQNQILESDINVLKEKISSFIPYSIGVIELRLNEKDFKRRLEVTNTYQNPRFLSRHPLLEEIKGTEEYEVIDRIKNPKRSDNLDIKDTYRDIQLRTMFGRNLIEFQFKTQKMHEENESGIFSHSKYKKEQDEFNCSINWFCDALKTALDKGDFNPLENVLHFYYPLRKEIMKTYDFFLNHDLLGEKDNLELEDNLFLLNEYLKTLNQSVVKQQIYHKDLMFLSKLPKLLIKKEAHEYYFLAIEIQEILKNQYFPVQKESSLYNMIADSIIKPIEKEISRKKKVDDLNSYIKRVIPIISEDLNKYDQKMASLGYNPSDESRKRVIDKVRNRYNLRLQQLMNTNYAKV